MRPLKRKLLTFFRLPFEVRLLVYRRAAWLTSRDALAAGLKRRKQIIHVYGNRDSCDVSVHLKISDTKVLTLRTISSQGRQIKIVEILDLDSVKIFLSPDQQDVHTVTADDVHVHVLLAPFRSISFHRDLDGRWHVLTTVFDKLRNYHEQCLAM